jgi:hypothetical protein
LTFNIIAIIIKNIYYHTINIINTSINSHTHQNQPISYLFAVSGAFFPSRLTSVRGVVEVTPSTTALGDVNPDDDFLRSFEALDGLDRVVLLVLLLLLMTLLLSSS